MPLNILLADDSVPAQNMGKKILTDAGYDVLTVGNGLEALRKINEAAPDIAILDIFMPGYTGLEICERLRANVATAALPVILTVGKLEPYRPEDGEHVHSNAVIVKPFAAAELVSAVRSLIGAPPQKIVIPTEAPTPQEGYYVADEGLTASSSPLDVDDFTSTPEQSIVGSQPDESDEPLFFVGQAAEDSGPFGMPEPSDSGIVNSPSSNFDLDGPRSLVFNPDAKPTPFSATVIDVASSSIPSAHETENPFAEFDLGNSTSVSELEPPVAEEPKLTSPGATEELAPAVRTDGTETSGSDSGPATVPEQAISGSVSMTLDSSTLDIPALDSLLAMQEGKSLSHVQIDRGSEEIPLEAESAHVDVDSGVATQPVGQSADQANEEEARRLAFEELFNSTESIPVENPIFDSDTIFAMLPNMADLSEVHPDHVAPDHELESLDDDRPSGFVAPELDPDLIREEESALGIHQRDICEPEHAPLLEDLLETSGGSEVEVRQVAVDLASPEEIYLPPLGDLSEVPQESPAELTPAEAQVPLIEDHPIEPETIAAAPIIEVEPHHDSEPAQSEKIQLEPLEENAVHGGLAQTEPVQVEPPQAALAAIEPLELDTHAPIAASNGSSVEAGESVSLPVAEPEPVVSEQSEPVPPVTAPLQPETPVSGLSLCPELVAELSEEERVSQAVDRVLDRLKRILVKAIVREMGRHD